MLGQIKNIFINLMAICCVLLLYFGENIALSKEIDQFTQRRLVVENLRDDSWQLDDHVNGLIARSVQCMNRNLSLFRGSWERLTLKCLKENFLDPVVPQLRSPIEEWVSNISRMHNFRLDDHGIYGGDVDYDDMYMGWYVEMSPILRINSVFFGVDKIGHFFTQGIEYLEVWLDKLAMGLSLTQAEEAVREYGHNSELGTLGIEGTGVYSYGDLAANWQGFQFFKNIVGVYIRWQQGRFIQYRRWQVATFVVEDFDEVINPVRLQSQRFYDKVRTNFWHSTPGNASICRQFSVSPWFFDERIYRGVARLRPEDYIWKWTELSAEHARWRLRINEICGCLR